MFKRIKIFLIASGVLALTVLGVLCQQAIREKINYLADTYNIQDKRTYYVSPDGNDSWDGTSLTYQGGTTGPWASLYPALHPLNKAVAGDTILVADGTYSVKPKLKSDSGEMIIENSGTENRPITFRAINRRKAILNIDNGNGRDTFWINGDWIRVEGFKFVGSNYDYMVSISGDHVVFDDGEIWGTTSNANVQDHIKVLSQAEYSEISNSYFSQEERHWPRKVIEVLGPYANVHHNTFENIIGDGGAIIAKGGSHHDEIHHNLFLNVGGSQDDNWTNTAVSVGGQSSLSHKYGEYENEYTNVYNNIFINSGYRPITFWEARNSSAYNNTIYWRRRGCICSIWQRAQFSWISRVKRIFSQA